MLIEDCALREQPVDWNETEQIYQTSIIWNEKESQNKQVNIKISKVLEI